MQIDRRTLVTGAQINAKNHDRLVTARPQQTAGVIENGDVANDPYHRGVVLRSHNRAQLPTVNDGQTLYKHRTVG